MNLVYNCFLRRTVLEVFSGTLESNGRPSKLTLTDNSTLPLKMETQRSKLSKVLSLQGQQVITGSVRPSSQQWMQLITQ